MRNIVVVCNVERRSVNMKNIELVIEIPEEIRLALINNIQLSPDQQSICDSYIKHAIINSTPLSKGHGDLVDRNDLLAKSYVINDYAGNEVNIIDRTTVETANTIIEAEKSEE